MLSIRLLDAIKVLARPIGKVVEVILPGVTVPARVLPAQAEEIVDDILKIKGPVARPESKNLGQKATQVTKDRNHL